MVQYQSPHLDATFGALSDSTRRGILEQLRRADASITALADRFQMTLTGMKKHVAILEKAGLVRTQKIGRIRTCSLGNGQLVDEAKWIEEHRRLWAERFQQLDAVLEEMKTKEQSNEH